MSSPHILRHLASPTHKRERQSRLNRPPGKSRGWPYVAPIVTFLLFTTAESYAPPGYYVYLYFAKALAVTAALFVSRETLSDIRPRIRVIPAALAVGAATFILWVSVDKLVPYPRFGERVGFDPYTAVESPALRLVFLAARLYGLVLLVPVMEELFWRSFLLRYFTRADFSSLPQGAFSWPAFWIVAAAFGVSHPEWVVAVLTACAYALLLRRTRSLFACVTAHATTNLLLGVYVLATGDWKYW